MANNMLSQEEINALLNGAASMDSPDQQAQPPEPILNEIEEDALGEIGNISMGTAATTLFTLLGRKVQITTPRVTETTLSELASSHPLPFVAVQVRYTTGLKGMNLLILKEDDVKVITSLMMGGDGVNDLPEQLDDIHLSAVSEAMNQMIGSASTSLSEMLVKKIDISPPNVYKVNFSQNELDPSIISSHEPVVCISFRMTVGDIIDSNIMQVLTSDFAKDVVQSMLGMNQTEEAPLPKQSPPEAAQAAAQPVQAAPSPQASASHPAPAYQAPPSQDAGPSYQASASSARSVDVKPAVFAPFDSPTSNAPALPENIDLIKDVLLKVTVELGKTVKSIDEVLQFIPGSVIELDKLVGEPLDVMVNGKKIAQGEVVVIDESYGIRISDIVKTDRRLKNL